LYNILIEFGIPLNLVRLTIMCTNETYSGVRTSKFLSDMFPIKNGLKQGDALSQLLFYFALEYAIRGFRRRRMACNLTVHITFWCVLIMLLYWLKAYIQ
jgi:hypothetical protein